MRGIKLSILLAAFALLVFSCGKKEAPAPPAPEASEANESTGAIHRTPISDDEILYWTCSMHPQVRSNKPGSCPICGMDLIPVNRGGDKGEISVDKKTAALIGIKSEPVQLIDLTKTLRLSGKIADDKELYMTQQEYLSGFRNLIKSPTPDDASKSASSGALIEAAKLRLSLMGYTDEDIRNLEKSSGPDKNLIYPGDNAWVSAEVYEQDYSYIKKGQKVTATFPTYAGEIFYGSVRFVEPAINSQTRSAKVRIKFANPDGKLKLGMYSDLEIKSHLGKRLAVPEDAIVDTGARKIVYLDLGDGRYKPQEVKTEVPADGYAGIISGLKAGDMVVAEGNFVLDSQSTLTGGQSLLYGSAEEIKETPPHRH